MPQSQSMSGIGGWLEDFDGLLLLAGVLCAVFPICLAQCGITLSRLDSKKRRILKKKGVESTCLLTDKVQKKRNEGIESFYYTCTLQWEILAQDGKSTHLEAKREDFIVRSDFASQIPSKANVKQVPFEHPIRYLPNTPRVFMLKSEYDRFGESGKKEGNCWYIFLCAAQIIFLLLGIAIALTGGLVTGAAAIGILVVLFISGYAMRHYIFSMYECDHDIEDELLSIGRVAGEIDEENGTQLTQPKGDFSV